MAISSTSDGNVVTTIVGTPTARRLAAASPTRSSKPATMTAASSPGNGTLSASSSMQYATRAWDACASKAFCTALNASGGQVPST